ncbi:hypothetical protein AB835_10395 [Candidatus Endobugula sertula]|uniref:Glycosyltransferase 2-like domain-containing protein n=1 Tax=Candidatus Endobugula sertula TaxID=62101 RepID=A0A1D2QNJ8_9GAMM|nr:hypothetical protein AB835_10395 [Candidatus Endobugula sertula]
MSITQAKVAIITITYNSSHFINDYLLSISPFLSTSSHHLVIVDNASSDNTCEILEQYMENHQLTGNMTVVKLTQNIGFGKGCNRGAEAARSFNPTHLWFLNPDTRVFKNSGQNLLSLLENTDKQVDFAGSVLVNRQGSPRSGAFRFPGLMNVFLSNMQLGILDKLFKQYTTATTIQDQPYQADWLTGASFMTKAECFYQLQGFDPYYFLYYEEVDLFYRAKAQGYSVWACPESQIFHISGASTGINNRKKIAKRLPSYWFESRRHYYLSNYGKLYFFIVDIIFIVSHTIWTIRATIQKKRIETPPYLISDTIKHSLLYRLLTRKHRHKSG